MIEGRRRGRHGDRGLEVRGNGRRPSLLLGLHLLLHHRQPDHLHARSQRLRLSAGVVSSIDMDEWMVGFNDISSTQRLYHA